jgi:hypothetical protein
VGVDHHLDDGAKGTSFFSHNVDSKFQQLALLVGAIKIANLARKG